MINKHKSNKIKENSNTVRHLNNGTDHRHSKSCCDQSSPARRTTTKETKAINNSYIYIYIYISHVNVTQTVPDISPLMPMHQDPLLDCHGFDDARNVGHCPLRWHTYLDYLCQLITNLSVAIRNTNSQTPTILTLLTYLTPEIVFICKKIFSSVIPCYGLQSRDISIRGLLDSCALR